MKKELPTIHHLFFNLKNPLNSTVVRASKHQRQLKELDNYNNNLAVTTKTVEKQQQEDDEKMEVLKKMTTEFLQNAALKI